MVTIYSGRERDYFDCERSVDEQPQMAAEPASNNETKLRLHETLLGVAHLMCEMGGDGHVTERQASEVEYLHERDSTKRLSGVHRYEAPNGELAAATIALDDAFPEVHEHAEAQVSLLLEGASAAYVERSFNSTITRTPFAPGTIIYVAPGKPHRVQWQGSGKMLNLYFPESFLREITEEGGFELPSRSVVPSSDVGVRAIGQMIMDEFPWAGSFSKSTVEHARFLMAVRLARLLNLASSHSLGGLLDSKRLQPAIDAMIAFPEKNFCLAELAGFCNVSVFHFARSFKVRFGSAPYAFQRMLRVERASKLLRETDLSIATIAYAIGFETPTNFSRMFRNHTGHSPKQFRRLSSNRA